MTTKGSDNPFPSVLIDETAEASIVAPAAGHQRLYIDSADNRLYRKNSADAATIVELTEAEAVAAVEAAGLTMGDDIDMSASQLKSDTIAESTGAAGVTVDGVLLKDAGLTATGAVDISAGSLILPQSATPTPTAEGSIAWDTDDFIVVGDGAATKEFHPVSVGAWTPSLGFETPGDESWAFTLQVGRWQRVGNRVRCDFYVTVSAMSYTTAAGGLRLKGLPFTAGGADISGFGTGAAVLSHVAATGYPLLASIQTGTTQARLRYAGSTSVTYITTAQITSTETPALLGSITYEV